MMKILNRILSAFCLTALLFSATSCLHEDPLINWDDMKCVIEFPYKSHAITMNEVKPGVDETFKLMVNYTIPYESDITEDIKVQLAVDESLVKVYNDGLASSAKKYELLPVSRINLPSEITIAKGKRLWSQELTVKTAGLEKGKYYILPVVLAGAPEKYILSGNFGHVYIRVRMAN